MLYFQPCKLKSFWRSHSFLHTFHTIISQMTWRHNDVTLLNKLWVIRNNCMKSMVLAKIEMSANYSRYFMNDEVHDAESNDPFELYVTWDESYRMTHTLEMAAHCSRGIWYLSFLQNLIFQNRWLINMTYKKRRKSKNESYWWISNNKIIENVKNVFLPVWW